jgi:hypothetical protein
MVRYIVLAMLLEFIIIHSAGFMGVALISDLGLARKTGAVLGLGVMYSTFVGAFALAFETWWPLVAFWGLTLNRLLSVLVHQAPGGGEKALLQQSWGISVILYLLGTFATLFLPLPRLGITPALVQALQLPGSGVWVDEPHRVVAFGFLYFGGQALYEVNAERWMRQAGETAHPQGV